MSDQVAPATRELRLLLTCAKPVTSKEDDAAIRRMLDEGVDWTAFAQEAIARTLASAVADTLARVAPDAVPNDILFAFRQIVKGTRAANSALLEKLRQRTGGDPSEETIRALGHACDVASDALSQNPNNAEAWRSLGHQFSRFGRRSEAIASFERAIALEPNDARNWRDCGSAMLAVSRNEKALGYIDKALVLDSRDTRSWTLRARALTATHFYKEAAEASGRALALDAGNIAATRVQIHAQLFACDWAVHEDLARRITDGLQAGLPIITPFNHLAVSNSEAANFKLAQIWGRAVPPSAKPLWRGEIYHHARIRIAYVSTDFRDTLSVNAIAGCFEGHDKTRFETTAISLGPDDKSVTRRRIISAFDRFIDARDMSDGQIAELLRRSEIDLVVDLNGYSAGRRTGILAHRPAPVQVNYLGFAGTMGMPFFDYIIADRVVIPPDHRAYYSEKVVYLPNSFFPTDRARLISQYTPSRAEAGLPESDFVFTCQNTAYKISSDVFDVWMRLLRSVDGSVLWLSSTIPAAIDVLRREAQNRGVAPERILFGARVAKRADHLARLRLADLFLDTVPYNAHTTACDALWAGLPLLTCMGKTFPARVAASLLYAMGMPELVTQSLSEYEELARSLAQYPQRLSGIKSKLLRNRETEALFDTPRFTRDLESAYVAMWERRQAGMPPKSFAVAG